MKNLFILIVLISLIFAGCSKDDQPKTRVIVTTDGEFDDRCSMVRFLLYANDFDVQGIIHSSSKFHWKGRGDVPGHLWNDVSWIEGHLNAYDKVYQNLIVHDPDYPTPDYLRNQVFEGNIDLAGDMEIETPGSNHIVDVLLNPDTSPVWLQAWGGSNTIARALKTIEEKHPDRKSEVEKKARVFLILLQDSTYENYIQPNWPNLTVLVSTAFECIGYPWKKRVPEGLKQYYLGSWMNKYILFEHGPLCDIYKRHLYGGNRTTGDFFSEGDSPSFMYEIPTGLNSLKNHTWGGWGGRFDFNGKYWESAFDDGDKFKTIYRWLPAYQNDFGARADWCVAENYTDANHPPVVKTKSKTKSNGEIEISAEGSSDPDGDKLSFKWWQYTDAGTYPGKLELTSSSQEMVTFKLPDDLEDGQAIHIICEVNDGREPSFTRYERIVVTTDGISNN